LQLSKVCVGIVYPLLAKNLGFQVVSRLLYHLRHFLYTSLSNSICDVSIAITY